MFMHCGKNYHPKVVCESSFYLRQINTRVPVILGFHGVSFLVLILHLGLCTA
jgi:hypothetical protein